MESNGRMRDRNNNDVDRNNNEVNRNQRRTSCYTCSLKKSTSNFPTMWLCVLFITGFLVTESWAHVGLTFPPARVYDLDFLDSIRTKAPCGMPKGSLKTSLISGSMLNVTWHLSYPHRGGYRLELMDSQERQLLDLTPKSGAEEFIKGDPTAQHHEVKLPQNFTCQNCTIRLLRQATEWANNYRFWSCADVDIVEPRKYKETCSGHGRAVVGRCVCNKGFSGTRCQYEDECETDAECGGSNGKCINLGGTALPRKQCFCTPGFHGERCKKRNKVKLPDSNTPLDISRHTKRVLSDRMTLFYNIIPAAKDENKEIEFILVIDGTSYGAIGWRPASFDKTCKRWPYIQNSTTDRQGKNAKLQVAASEPSAEPEPKAESEPEPESSSSDHKHKGHKVEPGSSAETEPTPEGASSEPESEAEAEPTSKDHGKHKHSKHEANAEPEPESAAEPHAETEPEPEGTSEPQAKEPVQTSTSSSAGKLRAKLKPSKSPEGNEEVKVETSSIVVSRSSRRSRSPEPEDSKAEPEPESEPESEPKSEPESEPESTASEPEPESEAEPHPEGEPEPEAGGSSVSKGGSKELKPSEWAPKGDFHAMDCIDLVMGGARGVHSRIRDYYTRDRSTPRLDTFWGGKEDITSAIGWEKDNKTVLIFRRKIRSTDGPDHTIDGEMHVIWARGQESGEYVHKPHSGIEKETPSVPNFYAPDEIKYHGHGAQRGITRIDFLQQQSTGNQKFNEGDCENTWAHPPGCSNADSSNPCSYNATWRYIPELDSIKFTIETRKTEKWTGIGFSDNPSMRNSDAILGWVTSAGQFFIMDTFMNSYTTPILDQSQDISNMTGKYRDGIVQLSFLRKVKTNDHAKDVSLDECRFFLFPVEGGTYNAVSKKIRKHDQTPIASPEKICIPRKCRPVKRVKPAEIRYQFDIKLTGGLGNNWKAPKRGSDDFNLLGNRIETDLGHGLKDIQGFNRLELTDIKRDGEGAVAHLDLMVQPNSELADKSRVERALKETISNGRVGALQIDPTYLELSSPEVQNHEEDDSNAIATTSAFGGQRLWIVLGCVAALILLALLQAGLTIYKISGKTSSHKGSPSSGSGMQWRDYSETNYGYDAYDEKHLGQNSMPLTAAPTHHPNGNSHGNGHGNGHGNSHHSNGHGQSLGHSNGNGHNTYSHHAPPNMSLPRPQQNSHSQPAYHPRESQSMRHHNNGGTTAASASHNPDFYFMPSQRKYSGEVVRVYVDHNNKR